MKYLLIFVVLLSGCATPPIYKCVPNKSSNKTIICYDYDCVDKSVAEVLSEEGMTCYPVIKSED